MKPFPLLLCLTLGLVAGYGMARLSRPAAPLPQPVVMEKEAVDEHVRDVMAAGLLKRDPEGVRDALRAAGWNENSVRSVVNALLYEEYDARCLELELKFGVKRGSPWWEDYWNGSEENNGDYQLALRKSGRERQRRLEALCGPPSMEDYRLVRRAYGNLPEAKLRRLVSIERDYAELEEPLMNETWGIRTKAENLQLEWLGLEKQKDIEALLTTDELAEWKKRESWSGKERMRLAAKMHASAEEMDLVDLYEEACNKLPTSALRDPFSPVDPDSPEAIARREAEEQVTVAFIGRLGLDRYRDFLRATAGDYQQFEFAVRRAGRTPEEAAVLYDRRYDYGAEALRLIQDDELTAAQKSAGLDALAAKAQAEAVATVGAELAEAMQDAGLLGWVTDLRTGNAINTLGPRGVQVHRKRSEE